MHLPLSWDDPATRLAIEKYMQSVRTDAPWCPSNIEFIRRINGLDSIDDVQRIVFDASYLVLGLGDVYLGAPVATPLDPRHRLVTTKYNPARTWTPENAVGIGGAYLCVYGMEGPGGYQFVGRTVQMWNRYRQTADFTRRQAVAAALLRSDPLLSGVGARAAEDARGFSARQVPAAHRREPLKLRDYRRFLADERDSDRRIQGAAAGGVRSGARALARRAASSPSMQNPAQSMRSATTAVPAGCEVVTSPVTGSVWKQSVVVGQQVAAGDELLVIEAMKMEIPIVADARRRSGRSALRAGPGRGGRRSVGRDQAPCERHNARCAGNC